MGKRREARELALMCMHQWDLRGAQEGEELADSFILERNPVDEVAEYARFLLSSYWKNWQKVDEGINAISTNWTLDRLAVVDRNILRLAVSELVYISEVPDRVTLNEAIELAKKYSTGKSGAFVNGILDRILNARKAHNG